MRFNILIIVGIIFSALTTLGQNCPPNIGFEKGDFTGWQSESGTIAIDGRITLNQTYPLFGRHDIIQATPALITDPYGDFQVNAPNGSGYSVRIGDTGTGTKADRISYTFVVPENQSDYNIIYNYAVVFYNPHNNDDNHADFEQPKFTAKIFDVSADAYIDCGSFDFVSSSGLLGFQQSIINTDVYYKPWAPITLNLSGYAGKTIRLEFTVNGCSKNNGRHFGYAYIDINENCNSPISGNVICDPSSITLSAPAGFQEYHWYNASDLSQELGTGNTLNVSPSPPENTTYTVKIIPFPGFGCTTMLYTTTQLGVALEDFNVAGQLQACSPTFVNITAAIAVNDPALKYTYFTDAEAITHVRLPTAIIEGGTYYIKATNATGCFIVKPVEVIIKSVNLIITDPLPSCFPEIVNITQASVTFGSEAGLTYTYWKDANALEALPNPANINISETYYIKGTDALGCYSIKPVTTRIHNIIVYNQSSCHAVNLTAASVKAGSSPDLLFTYWLDDLATINLPNPDEVTTSGIYFIKGTSAGCSKVVPVQVTIYPFETVNIIDPSPVTFPEMVDLTLITPHLAGYSYSFWRNKEATTDLTNPQTVDLSGTYYLKVISSMDCEQIFPLTVIVNEPPPLQIITSNTFTPNNDGINDFFKISILGEVHVNYLKIYNRWGQLIFNTRQISNFWDGTMDGKIQPPGTYYWMFDGSDRFRKQQVKVSGSITLLR